MGVCPSQHRFSHLPDHPFTKQVNKGERERECVNKFGYLNKIVIPFFGEVECMPTWP